MSKQDAATHSLAEPEIHRVITSASTTKLLVSLREKMEEARAPC